MPANKSVLLFYQINHTVIDTDDFAEIWNRYISSNSDEARCINAIHCDISAEKLLHLIKERIIEDEVLLEIQAQYEKGANVLFIVPAIGSPIGGFFISKLISH